MFDLHLNKRRGELCVAMIESVARHCQALPKKQALTSI